MSNAMMPMPAPTVLPDDAGTYFERHEDYERRLRENSHRWYVPRIVPMSLMWQNRLVITSGVLSALAEIAMLSYFVYILANGELLLVLLHVVKQNAVVAGAGLVLVILTTMISFRMPLCVIYFESVLILLICAMHGYLACNTITIFSSIPDHIQQAWTDAPADVHGAVQRRYSCNSETPLCIDILSDRLKLHLTVIVIMQAVTMGLQLLTAWAALRLARSISKQSSFRIL